MIKVTVLLENYSISDQYETKHGLSLLIENDDKTILLDTGPDNKFIKNAEKMNLDTAKVNYLFLSHNHNDHTGGLIDFLKINKTAPVYLMDNVKNKYYTKRSLIKVSIGLKLNKTNSSRVIQTGDDLNMNNKIYFLKNSISNFQKSSFNNTLFKKEKGRIVNDTFDHEGILILEDNNELIIFNSCSHNGLLNIAETVKAKIPGKKIRAYIGGLHLSSQKTLARESNEYLDQLINGIKKESITVYTGHCTGKSAVNYLKEKLGDMVQEINTGMEVKI